MPKKILLLCGILFVLMCSVAAAAPAAPEGELRRVTFVLPRGLECLDDPHFLSAIYLGFFKQEGIEFIMLPSYGSDVTKMVAEGRADISAPSPAASMAAIAAGIKLVSVFQTDVNNIFGIAVLEDSPIKTWVDLNGKTIAANNANTYMNITPSMKEGGADPSTVKFVVAGSQRSVMLAEKVVDAAFTWQKEWQNWKAQGVNCRFLDGESVLQNCANSICTTPEFFAKNADVLKRVGRAIAKGIYFVQRNPLAAAAITVKRYPGLGLTPEQALPAVAALPLIATPANGKYGMADLERWKKCLEWNIFFKAIEPNTVDLASFIKNDFVEDYNNWDRGEINKIADNFDIKTVAW